MFHRLCSTFRSILFWLHNIFKRYYFELIYGYTRQGTIFKNIVLFSGIGVGMTRDCSTLMVAQYFKRKREFVEIFIVSGSGMGIAVMSSFIKGAIRYVYFKLNQFPLYVIWRTFCITKIKTIILWSLNIICINSHKTKLQLFEY